MARREARREEGDALWQAPARRKPTRRARGAYAIRALPDLSSGIEIGASS